MKKKITIIDKSFTPIVVLADTSSALYEDRCGRLGERNLLSDTEIVCKAMDGTKEIASVKAHVLQVPTKKLPLEALHATEQNPIPAKQLVINYLCQKNAEVETLCEREKTDSVAMVLPITTHLYIESLVVDTPHRKLGIATAMLDFLISMAAPETVSMFAGHEQAEVKFKKDKKAEVKEDKKPEGDKKVAKPAKKGGSNVILGVSCAVMVAAVGVMGMTMVQNKNADKSSIPAVGGSFSVTGNIAEDTSFTEQAAVAPSTALTSDGRQWAMGASNILIQAEDGTGAVVPVDAAETFQYDGKSLSFEKDGATYIVRMVADSYTGAAQYAEEQTDESFTVSGMRFAGNGQELVVVGTRSAGDEEGNAAVRTAVADMLEKAVPAQGSGNITLNGVAVTADGCEASFSNGLALIKSGDGEVKFTPSSYDSETIAFDDAGTTASGAAVTHSDYANVNDTEAYLIESDEGNVMAFTNNADLLTSVLGLQ